MTKMEKELIEKLERACQTEARVTLRLIRKLQKGNQVLTRKLKEIETIVDTTPYVAYTLYGDLLYESDEILKIIRGE